MRGKRAKQYRKLMQQYALHFGFREPYQVLLDADVMTDASRFKMNFTGLLERCLHGQIKPMITQCSMRHLYNAKPKDEDLINHAKGFERRRCGHHELEEPLSTLECFKSVIDPKGSRINKFRYVVVCQDPAVRAYLRTIPGVPIIYLKRSVMIMEPMAGSTEQVVDRDEEQKFLMGLKGRRDASTHQTMKRKRVDDQDTFFESGDGTKSGIDSASTNTDRGTSEIVAPKRRKKAQAPNPLSVKKKAKAKDPRYRPIQDKQQQPTRLQATKGTTQDDQGIAQDSTTTNGKSRRPRKHARAPNAETLSNADAE